MPEIPLLKEVPRDIAEWTRFFREVFLSGDFTGTLTGCATSPTGSLRYETAHNVVTIQIPAFSATSNTTAMTITGMPATLFPARQQIITVAVTDSGTTALGTVTVETTGVLTFAADITGAAFTASGTKGVPAATITYNLQ